MYEEEHAPRKGHHALAILAAVIFGAGSLWAGTYGLNLALPGGFHLNSSTTAGTTDNRAIAFGAVDISSLISNASSLIQKGIGSIQLPRTPVNIVIGGDIMFDRKIRLMAQNKGYDYPLSSVAPLFKSADIAIANLEGPITPNASKTLRSDGTTGTDLTFTFAPATAKALADAGLTAVSLANNHSYNFGAFGVTQTRGYLKSAGVGYFGSPWNSSSTELVISQNGMNIAFVGYHAFEPGFPTILANVKALTAEGDFVIVMPHWGEEYSAHPTDSQREQAKQLVAAGAKAIIGSHPHVIQDHETVAGVPVYYSVGNLLFDQYFSNAVMNGNIISLKLVNGPAGPSIGEIQTYGVQLDKAKGVVLK